MAVEDVVANTFPMGACLLDYLAGLTVRAFLSERVPAD
jgi:hypothetical protein